MLNRNTNKKKNENGKNGWLSNQIKIKKKNRRRTFRIRNMNTTTTIATITTLKR